MPRLDSAQIDHLNGLMNERWAREFREIRSLMASLGDERQRAVFAERAASAPDEGLLETLAGVDDAPHDRKKLLVVIDEAVGWGENVGAVGSVVADFSTVFVSVLPARSFARTTK